jgi:hypothetical protein
MSALDATFTSRSERTCFPWIQHHAPFDLTFLEVGEDRVDVAQWRSLYLSPHLALDSKCDCLVEVATRSYDGAAHGD